MPSRGMPSTNPAPPLPRYAFARGCAPARHAVAVQQIDLFVQRHLLQHHVGALVRRETGLHPGLILCLGFGLIMTAVLRVQRGTAGN